jgi:surface antigen
MATKLSAALMCALMATSACATKSGTGAAVGATGGGIIGAAIGGGPGLLIGAAAGGLLGYTAGRAMEEEDRRRVSAALEANRAASWTSYNGNRYHVVPTQTSMQGNRECREFRMDANVGRDQEQVYGTACRQPNGQWELVSG